MHSSNSQPLTYKFPQTTNFLTAQKKRPTIRYYELSPPQKTLNSNNSKYKTEISHHSKPANEISRRTSQTLKRIKSILRCTLEWPTTTYRNESALIINLKQNISYPTPMLQPSPVTLATAPCLGRLDWKVSGLYH